MSLIESLDQLKEGSVLALKDGTLFLLRQDKVVIHHPQWHTLLSIQETLALYGHYEVFEVGQQEGIDETKDEAYYEWARRAQ